MGGGGDLKNLSRDLGRASRSNAICGRLIGAHLAGLGGGAALEEERAVAVPGGGVAHDHRHRTPRRRRGKSFAMKIIRVTCGLYQLATKY